jgi:hypothetical protein
VDVVSFLLLQESKTKHATELIIAILIFI